MRNFNLIEFLKICERFDRNPAYFFEGTNNYTFTNCVNGISNGDFIYNEKEVSEDTLKFLMEAITDKLNKI